MKTARSAFFLAHLIFLTPAYSKTNFVTPPEIADQCLADFLLNVLAETGNLEKAFQAELDRL